KKRFARSPPARPLPQDRRYALGRFKRGQVPDYARLHRPQTSRWSEGIPLAQAFCLPRSRVGRYYSPGWDPVPPTKKSPEEEARELIDSDLVRAGWVVQDR